MSLLFVASLVFVAIVLIGALVAMSSPPDRRADARRRNRRDR